MPDTRQHRGPHPEDSKLFDAAVGPVLQQAVRHLSWLLSLGYAECSSLKLVGDRFNLRERQRIAVRRASCSDAARMSRDQRRLPPGRLQGAVLDLDAFNLLLTVETALSGGLLLQCQDGCLRDMASIHGSYRKVEETRPALELIAETFSTLSVQECRWWFDAPVSNSGRLKSLFLELVEARSLPWRCELVDNPDRLLRESQAIVVTADSVILDHCQAWFNGAREVIERWGQARWQLDLSDGTSDPSDRPPR